MAYNTVIASCSSSWIWNLLIWGKLRNPISVKANFQNSYGRYFLRSSMTCRGSSIGNLPLFFFPLSTKNVLGTSVCSAAGDMVTLVGTPLVSSVSSGWLEGNFLGMDPQGPALFLASHGSGDPEDFMPSYGCLQKLEKPFAPSSAEKAHSSVFWFLKIWSMSKICTVINWCCCSLWDIRCSEQHQMCGVPKYVYVGDKQAMNESVLAQCAELHLWSLTGFFLSEWGVFVSFFYGVAMHSALLIIWEFFPKQRLTLCMCFILVCAIF